jgi:hypothetical protein
MATMTFSIPDNVQKAFDAAFEGSNKDAIVADLLRQAIKERLPRDRPAGLVERLRQIRARSRPMTDDEIRRAREELRR